MTKNIQWPRKTHELHSHHVDSTIWNDFRFRDDDIIIATYAKSGTTWMQQNIAQKRRMAAYLDIRVDESRWETIVGFCSFEWMKLHATKSVPLAGVFWYAGAQVFINQAKNGRWNEILSATERKEYGDLAVEKLGAECACWLATGEEPAQ